MECGRPLPLWLPPGHTQTSSEFRVYAVRSLRSFTSLLPRPTAYHHNLPRRIRVRTTGEPIGWREAWRRSAVDLLFALAAIIGSFSALAVIPDSQYYSVGWPVRSSNLEAHQPPWIAWTGTAAQIWVWSEVLVMLFNKQRRALHDFIAGTIVISEE